MNKHPKGRPFADYTGQRRGKLYVEKCIIPSDSYRNQWGLWLCICDCGKTVELKGEALKARSRNSCGCLMNEAAKKLTTLRMKPDTVTYNGLYKAFKVRCRRMKSPTLTKEQWSSIVLQPCHYCGEMDNRNRWTRDTTKNSYITEEQKLLYTKKINGIDRVDNTQGYHLDNCVPCCTMCNTMKMSSKQDAFFDKVQQIHTINAYRNISIESMLCN
jgi:hypothetical protein